MKNKRGGKREGAGRKPGTRKHAVTVRISDAAWERLQQHTNKSRYIDNLILGDE